MYKVLTSMFNWIYNNQVNYLVEFPNVFFFIKW